MRHCQSVLDSVSANGKLKKEKEKNLTMNIIFYSISAVCDIYRLQFKQHEPTKIHSNTSYGECVEGHYPKIPQKVFQNTSQPSGGCNSV